MTYQPFSLAGLRANGGYMAALWRAARSRLFRGQRPGLRIVGQSAPCGADTPRPGEPFVPYRQFTGVVVPDALLQCPELSPGAKLCYGRLTRYAGRDGKCYPSFRTLAHELGVSRDQARNYVEELTAGGFLRLIARTTVWGTPDSYDVHFLWHVLFRRPGENLPREWWRILPQDSRGSSPIPTGESSPTIGDDPPPGTGESSPTLGDDPPPHKENHLNESGNESSNEMRPFDRAAVASAKNTELTDTTYRDWLRNALQGYMATGYSDPDFAPPDDEILGRVIDACGHAAPDVLYPVLRALYAREPRPHSYGWFLVMLRRRAINNINGY